MSKLSVMEIKDGIADAIRDAVADRLSKNNPFTNDSLTYVGAKFRWLGDITLLARNGMEVELKLGGSGTTLAKGEREQDGRELPTVSVEVEHTAGKMRKK
jgi:hypothetical protein